MKTEQRTGPQAVPKATDAPPKGPGFFRQVTAALTSFDIKGAMDLCTQQAGKFYDFLPESAQGVVDTVMSSLDGKEEAVRANEGRHAQRVANTFGRAFNGYLDKRVPKDHQEALVHGLKEGVKHACHEAFEAFFAPGGGTLKERTYKFLGTLILVGGSHALGEYDKKLDSIRGKTARDGSTVQTSEEAAASAKPTAGPGAATPEGTAEAVKIHGKDDLYGTEPVPQTALVPTALALQTT